MNSKENEMIMFKVLSKCLIFNWRKKNNPNWIRTPFVIKAHKVNRVGILIEFYK